MRTNTILTAIIIICLYLIGCVNPNESNPNEAPAADNSRTSLDWHGVYTGTLPCADCEGMLTMIKLQEDLTYELESTYLGKSVEIHAQKGSFSWNTEGTMITLTNVSKDQPSMYTVGENKLTQLDLHGNAITGDLASRYILTKVNGAIVEQYWKLIELQGSPVTTAPQGGREAHMMLKAANNQVVGNGGCNSFSGSFKLSEGDRISFANLIATEMACPNLAIETKYFEVLSMTDNYTVRGDTLSLNKARMAPLARFAAISIL
jgi:copper homeostasis protein (lipoprotein)